MFNGFEIDMLSLGDADSILVTQWRPDRLLPIRVLIDGGNTGSADSILAFLWSRGIRLGTSTTWCVHTSMMTTRRAW